MEISTPTKIIEGNSKVLGVTTGVVPGCGDCAIITSASAINIYSTAAKNISATWTFPTNQRECITSSTYITNEQGYDRSNLLIISGLACCQGGNTMLQWKSSSPSAKSFIHSDVFLKLLYNEIVK